MPESLTHTQRHTIILLLLRHGEAYEGQNVPGLLGLMPPSLQLCALPCPPGQPRRSYFKGEFRLLLLITILCGSLNDSHRLVVVLEKPD